MKTKAKAMDYLDPAESLGAGEWLSGTPDEVGWYNASVFELPRVARWWCGRGWSDSLVYFANAKTSHAQISFTASRTDPDLRYIKYRAHSPRYAAWLKRKFGE